MSIDKDAEIKQLKIKVLSLAKLNKDLRKILNGSSTLLRIEGLIKSRSSSDKKAADLSHENELLKIEVSSAKLKIDENKSLRDQVNNLTAENGKHLRKIKRLENKK